MTGDELNQNQGSIPEGEEPEDDLASRVAELETLLSEKEAALAKATTHITELEQSLAESEERLKAANDSLAEAVTSYKAMVTQANPEVPEELISGDSVETVEQSLAQAKGLISRVKEGLEAEIQALRIPTGAPQRTPPDLSALSPREKIQYGVRR